MKGADPRLALSEVIEVASWRPSDDFEVHPLGAKPKSTLICPDPAPHPLLIPNHAYLFKIAEGWKENQIWSEALAYQVGSAVGIDVPPCFIASNSTTGVSGALVEFFYGYPGEPLPRRLTHGADMLQERGFTLGADRPHNLITNVKLCEERGLTQAKEWWARTIWFDALIGNTDRHTENWGVLVGADGSEQFAPRYDNGTSLGFQQLDAKLPRFSDPVALDRFIAKGCGHLGWSDAQDTPLPLVELCREFAVAENAGELLKDVIHADVSPVEAAIDACVRMRLEPAFTAQRGEFVLKLIRRRLSLLSEACGV